MVRGPGAFFQKGQQRTLMWGTGGQGSWVSGVGAVDACWLRVSLYRGEFVG